MLLTKVFERLEVEGLFARHDFIRNQSERVQIRLNRSLTASKLLGRHVVGRLEIAMQHPLFVRSGDARGKLPYHLDALVARQPTNSTKQDPEILAIDVLHRQKMDSLRLTDVVHATHARVGDLPRQPHLLMKEL